MVAVRGILVSACLIAGGCTPREDPSITAVDPLNSIPAIQEAAKNRDRRAIPALIKQLDNDDPAIRFYAITALHDLTGQTFGYHYFDNNVARQACGDAVAGVGGEESREPAMTAASQLQLRITSDPANLAPVRHQIEGFCAVCGFDEESRGQIGLCVNEALANITRHAYHLAKDGPIQIDIEFDSGMVRISIRDWGTGKTPPLRPIRRDPLEPGGVGMVCLRELMDNITFSPQIDGMLLTMERKLDYGKQGFADFRITNRRMIGRRHF